MKNNIIFVMLQSEFFHSDITSGEFIHTIPIPDNILGNELCKEDIIEGIQKFLDWDKNSETFDVIKFGNTWYTTNHHATYEDYFTFNWVNYPTKILNVTIDADDDEWVHSYLIAPESLLDAVGEDSDIDNEVYHYVEDKYWDLPNNEIAKHHLDTPMTLISNEDE